MVCNQPHMKQNHPLIRLISYYAILFLFALMVTDVDLRSVR